MGKQQTELTSEELKKKLQEKELQEITACKKEFDAAYQKYILPVLKKHGCDIIYSGQFQGNQIVVNQAIYKPKV